MRFLSRAWRQLLVAAILCHVIQADLDRTVCDPDAFRRQYASNPGPSKPLLATNYAVRIEANIVNANRTVDAHEYFDFTNNRGALHQWDQGIHTHVIFDTAADELITVTYPDRADPLEHETRCEVQNLTASNNGYLLGARKYANGSEHIYNIGDTLRMAVSTPDIYLGVQVREDGVITEAWRSCLYMDSLQATFNATWYFTASNTWFDSMGGQSPLSLHIQGKTAGPDSHDFEHEYIFTEYRPNFADYTDTHFMFETPEGVFCPGRLNTMPLPNVTDNFSFKSEITDVATQFITTIEEYYSYDMRVVRYEYQEMAGSYFGSNPIRRIHDFNTGVAYNIDKIRGNCSMTQIRFLGFDAESSASAHMRMRTKQEFFDLNAKYTYTGQRTVRGIECDVWLTVKDDWPPGARFETHWEWFFATRSWMESAGYQYEVRLPVQLRLSSDTTDPPFERIFSIYDYREGQNQPWDYDISPCFTGRHRKEYTLTMPGNYSKYVQNVNGFIYFFVLAVTANAQVSALRVARIMIYHDDVNIYGSFSLLDKAPIPGDVTDAEPERTLQQAADNLESAIRAGTFVVKMELTEGGTVVSLPVTNFTVGTLPHGRRRRDTSASDGVDNREVNGQVQAPEPSSSTSYSSSAMAGLGLAMIIVGYVLGFALMWFGYRQFLAPRRLEFDNPLTELRKS